MAHYERVIHSPKRLTTPLRRIGKKGIGPDQFTSISWDEALERIVETLNILLIPMVVKVFFVIPMRGLWGCK